VTCHQHDIEGPGQVEVGDPRVDGVRAADVREDLGGGVDGGNRMAELDERVRDPSGAAAQVEDGGPAGTAAWTRSASPWGGKRR
jgi:hypothetical protein